MQPHMLPLFVLACAVATMSAPTELYFEFDDRATSVSVSPGQFFCNAATSVLTPTFADNSLWCLGRQNFSYVERVAHGRLSNARITLPATPVSRFDSETNRGALSAALLDSGFFLSPANVTFVVNWKHDQDLNVGLTVATFCILLLTVLISKCRAWYSPRPNKYEQVPGA